MIRSLRIAVLLASTSMQAQVATVPALPSGLSPVSQLTVEGSQLALASNGALYRSDDHGKHWRQVKQQWGGKAIELLGIPALTSAPGSGQSPRTEADPETYAAVLLKSTTTLHWVSVDRGKTWNPSTLDDVRRNDIKWSAQSVSPDASSVLAEASR
jgi:BNR-Asp box repeat